MAGHRIIMHLALFDLDNTLLDGDSDYEWAQFLIEQGVLERATYEAANQRYYDQYKAGTLNIYEFLDFQLAPLARYPREQLDGWHAQFMQNKIRPIILDAARRLLGSHISRGDLCAIVTATSSFITAPIARELGVANLIATEPQICDGRFTGKPAGLPCFGQCKPLRVEHWLREQGLGWDSFAESTFFTDSINDLPLLEKVSRPFAVDPDPRLAAVARERNWQTISLR
jgi:HAD superfamily hydrolase (TIGR01490 family)